MKKLVACAFIFIILFAGVTASLYVREEMRTPYPETASTLLLEIPRGVRVRDVVRLLQDRNVVHNEYVALGYIFYSGLRHKIQAGEYMFDHPMTPIEVVNRIASGNVYLHKFTVPEGLTIDETAAKWQEQGFGTAEDFKEAAQESLSLVTDLDPKAPSVEGYLFPETYSFPAHTSAKQAVQAMILRFKSVMQRLEEEQPEAKWPLDIRGTVILASLVESEAAKEDERVLVASVYLNRLERKILLQCDPTVIYALEQADRYQGRLTLADLKFPSPYNTYVSPGLPPGPIMNPGYASLHAAIQPAATKFLYFVRTVEGRHTFSENLAAHNKAVAAYRAMQRRAHPNSEH